MCVPLSVHEIHAFRNLVYDVEFLILCEGTSTRAFIRTLIRFRIFQSFVYQLSKISFHQFHYKNTFFICIFSKTNEADNMRMLQLY